ncbi:MAG: phosphatase PAP2 family protein [Nanoarchaeota archaeon]|nr:phosphatase PAP2 family protein [Nanoarchaeota archaeon]
MIKKKEVFILAAIFLALILSFYFDKEVIQLISLAQNAVFTDFFIGITFISSEIIIFFFLTSLFLWQDNKRKWILPLWFTLLMTIIISFFLKIIVQRERPFQLGIIPLIPALESASYTIWNYSFPSFQAMLAFSAIPILSKEFPKFKWVWIVFAFLVGFSRVYFGVHFLSDVISGGLIGYFIGAIVIRIEKENGFWGKIYKIILRK